MKIKKYDKPRDFERVKKLLKDEEEYLKRFQEAAMLNDDVMYIADYNGEVIGLLILQRFSNLRVTPTVYIDKKYRRKGIGTDLIRISDKILPDSIYENAICEFSRDDGIAEFLTKNGYHYFYSEYLMERDNTLIDNHKVTDAALLERGIVIRNYRDEDYLGWHSIEDVAFFLMRQEVGLKPPYYYPPSEARRKELARNCENRYVMTVKGVVVAACRVGVNEIALLGVRPDQQSKGYGRIMIAYLNNKFIMEQQANKVTIGVIDGNPAKRLYDRLGFREVGYLYDYIKFYKPDSRQKAPKGYTSKAEIINEFRLHGMLKEKMEP